jgi:hypothetical protein
MSSLPAFVIVGSIAGCITAVLFVCCAVVFAWLLCTVDDETPKPRYGMDFGFDYGHSHTPAVQALPAGCSTCWHLERSNKNPSIVTCKGVDPQARRSLAGMCGPNAKLRLPKE